MNQNKALQGRTACDVSSKLSGCSCELQGGLLADRGFVENPSEIPISLMLCKTDHVPSGLSSSFLQDSAVVVFRDVLECQQAVKTGDRFEEGNAESAGAR